MLAPVRWWDEANFIRSFLCAYRGFVMRNSYEQQRAEQTEIERTLVQGDARMCRPIFGRVCKAIWPHKTAEQLAVAVGCSVRAAAYEISGEREPSAKSIFAIHAKLLERG